MANQRLPKDTRVLMALEATRNSDTGITTVYVVPLSAESGVGKTQDLVDIPIGMGDGLPAARVLGLSMYGGGLPVAMDFKFVGIPLRTMWTGYSKVGASSAYWHEFFEDVATYGARPLSYQLQADFLEATAKYRRGKSNLSPSIDWSGDVAGGAVYTLNAMGNGNVVETDILTVLSLSATSYGLGGQNNFYGQIRYSVDGTEYTLDGVTAFTCQQTRPVAREEGYFSGDGTAVDMPIGVLDMQGSLGLPMRAGGSGPTADLNFLHDAENHKVVTLDYLQTNGPLLTCTAYLRTRIKVYLTPMDPKPVPGNLGQAAGLKLNQAWKIARMESASDMAWPAEYHGPTRGTYAVTGSSNDKLGIKVDGGGTQTITLTAGAARTVDQIVTDINATLTGAVADNWHGWLRITSDTAGSSSSIQIDTGVANTGHALFGFTNTARTGKSNCPARQTLFNGISADYSY